MGMENAQRMLLAGAVVPQHQQQPVGVAYLAQNGRDGIMRCAVGFCIDVASRVTVAAPCLQNLVGQVNHLFRLGSFKAQSGQRPVQNGGLYTFHRGLHHGSHAGLIHGELIAAALEVVMVEDGTAYDGQVSIAAKEIMRKLSHKGKQPTEGAPVNLHGGVLTVEHNAVFRIVCIGGILHVPGSTVQGQGHNAVILPGREVAAASVAWVFHAQHALGITNAGSVLQLGNFLGILLRLAQVDGDF